MTKQAKYLRFCERRDRAENQWHANKPPWRRTERIASFEDRRRKALHLPRRAARITRAEG